MSLTFQHHKEPSVASSQDHSRNDSGFSTNSTNNSSLENEKEIPSYATKVYGQHLKTWQQICQENEISSYDSPLDNDNFCMMINDSFKSPVIPEFRVNDISGNDILQSKQESPTSASNSFFSNLKAAMKSHSVSPTKRYGIFSSNHESASTSTTQQSTLKLQPRIQRSKSNSSTKETKKAKSAITKKRSFIFDSTSNSLFSLKDDNTVQESSSEPKRTNLVKGTSGEKKDKKLSSSPGLFATLGAKFPGSKGGGSGD